jgi:hypothetical protein
MVQLSDHYQSLSSILAEIIKQPREDLFEFSYFFPKSIELFTFDQEALPGLFSYLAAVIETKYERHATIINNQVQFIESLFDTNPEILEKLYDVVISSYFTIKQTERASFYANKLIELLESTGTNEKRAEGVYKKWKNIVDKKR